MQDQDSESKDFIFAFRYSMKKEKKKFQNVISTNISIIGRNCQHA